MLTTPRGLRFAIGLFGRRNAGKSSLANLLAGHEIAIVSEVAGTTTDPVERAFEMAPLGPVTLIDTPGLDDEGDLGAARVARARASMDRVDLAVVVVDGHGLGTDEEALLTAFAARSTPVVAVFNKADVLRPRAADTARLDARGVPWAALSALGGEIARAAFRTLIVGALPPDLFEAPHLVADLVPAGGHAVLVVPIDLAAPKGRLILPQVMAIRDLLDADASCTVVKERELADALARLNRAPDLVICDSQIVLKAAADTPPAVPLTTFSILMARFKSDLVSLARGAAMIDRLKPGDRVLIAEACGHHAQADDIGRVKIPRWFRQYAGGDLRFDVAAGRDYPDDLTPYALVVQCGACTVTRKEMLLRLRAAEAAGVPVTNYGLAISRVQGVLARTLAPFPAARRAFDAAGRAAA